MRRHSRIDPADLERAVRLARSVIPRGKLGARLRGLSKQRLVVDAFLLTGCASAKAFRSKWHPLFLRAVAIVLSARTDAEGVVRSIRGWLEFESMGRSSRKAIEREVARGLREDREERKSA